jgi:hypothetical protein
MKKPLLFLTLLAVVLYFGSCQKELSVETGSIPSVGSLQSDVSGDCLPKTVAGIYEAGKALNGTTDYIEVQVDVTTTGSYTIYTDTVNGIWFRAVGVFTATGLNTVKLKGSGNSANAGVNVYLINYGNTDCSVAITTLPAGAANPAVLTLSGAPNACMVSNTAGSYIVGVPLDISNTVTIEVNVTSLGTYTVTTPVSNGIIFSGTGVVQQGIQNITLNGTGTPIVAGPTNVVVTIGTSTCTFAVTVTGTAPVTNNDHFPLTANSWWSYDDPDGVRVSGDSLTVLNAGAVTYTPTGDIYRVFQHQNETTAQDSFFYRKMGNNYVELSVPVDYYTGTVLFGGTLLFDQPLIGEFIFLKEGLATNDTWESTEFSGMIGGNASKLKYTFKCIDANATVSVNGKSYANVYKISWKPQIKIGAAPYIDELVSHESWYAKGIGLVQWRIDDLTGQFLPSYISLKNYQVL